MRRWHTPAGTVVAKSPVSCNGVAAGQGLQTYFIGADPLANGATTGSRHFGVNQAGAIYQSTARISAFYTGAPPAPATMVQSRPFLHELARNGPRAAVSHPRHPLDTRTQIARTRA